MFESDDFDQVLSQFDFAEVTNKDVHESDKKSRDENRSLESGLDNGLEKQEECLSESSSLAVKGTQKQSLQVLPPSKPPYENGFTENFKSPKHTKRKLINSHFDHKSKRKFPGPAGLLTGTLEESNADTISHIELLSQDIEYSENNLRKELFESSLWMRLQEDLKVWNLHKIDNIRNIKQQALAGNLQRLKAQTVTAFVETVDRSGTDPLVILRDPTGHIKCTLHRDAWSAFSMYVVSEFCCLVLWRPTVLTTGGAFKKHYLNITLSNIYAIYSSAVVTEEDKEDRRLPQGYVILSDDDYTVIKTDSIPQDLGFNSSGNVLVGAVEENLFGDLDSIFSDDLF